MEKLLRRSRQGPSATLLNGTGFRIPWWLGCEGPGLSPDWARFQKLVQENFPSASATNWTLVQVADALLLEHNIHRSRSIIYLDQNRHELTVGAARPTLTPPSTPRARSPSRRPTHPPRTFTVIERSPRTHAAHALTNSFHTAALLSVWVTASLEIDVSARRCAEVWGNM